MNFTVSICQAHFTWIVANGGGLFFPDMDIKMFVYFRIETFEQYINGEMTYSDLFFTSHSVAFSIFFGLPNFTFSLFTYYEPTPAPEQGAYSKPSGDLEK